MDIAQRLSKNSLVVRRNCGKHFSCQKALDRHLARKFGTKIGSSEVCPSGSGITDLTQEENNQGNKHLNVMNK